MEIKWIVVLVLFLVASLSLARGLKLRKWLPLKGKVLGSASGLDSSAVRIEYKDPQGVSRTFESNIRFGHSYWAKKEDRIPYKVGSEVAILVNPQDFADAELATKFYLWIAFLLFLMIAVLSYSLIVSGG